MRTTLFFIGASIGFLILALLSGIFRLMSLNSIQTGILVNLYLLHPILMVFGFLASIVMTERVAGVALIPGLRNSRLPSITIPCTTLGVIGEVLGYAYGVAVFRFVGAALLATGCVVFAVVLLQLSSKTGARLPFAFMILSVFSLLGGAILSAFFLPVDRFGYIMLLLSFPTLFILGERVELTRFISTASTNSRFRISFLFAVAAVSFFGLGSLDVSKQIEKDSILVGFALLVLVFVLSLVTEVKNLQVLSRSKLPLQHYVSVHVRIAYAWGLFGLVLAMIYLANNYMIDLYDPFLHSIAVGFIGTMLLAHGPVILPSVTGRRLKQGASLTIAPLVLLVLGNLSRVGGDLITSWTGPTKLVEYVVGLSGWLVLACVLVFLAEIMRKTSGNDESFQRES